MPSPAAAVAAARHSTQLIQALQHRAGCPTYLLLRSRIAADANDRYRVAMRMCLSYAGQVHVPAAGRVAGSEQSMRTAELAAGFCRFSFNKQSRYAFAAGTSGAHFRSRQSCQVGAVIYGQWPQRKRELQGHAISLTKAKEGTP